MPSNEALTPLLRQFRVLIAGGSYGGLSAALSLLDLSKGRLARFNYTEDHLIGSPKALACDKFASKTWTRFCDIPALKSPNLQIVRGSVNTVDFQNKVAQIVDLETQETRQEKYDFFIAGTGLRRVFPTVPQSLKREEFLKEALSHKEAIRGADDGVVVIGGGAVGVEMAAELKELDPQQKVTLVHSRHRLLSAEPLPDEFAERVVSELREQGVEVILGQRVIDTTAVEGEQGKRTWDLTLANGTKLRAGHIMNAVSKSSPTSSYLPKDALTEEGYVKIRPNLQFANPVPNAEYHFAVGDIAQWAGIKRCGGAIHHGHYAGTNIHQLMLAEATKGKPEFMNLIHYPPVMGLALGHTAVSYTPDEGTKHGKELLGALFGEDMGYSICWNYMKMSEPCQA
ncbi:putative apoptosis inducing factor [Aspergillus nomiae NRRL 13137]|uniref:Putative apoptosis inducing factor n=1 Tax=Aspergillus nomiae NRRL (strain ATCC 15546 / NRRL 13137 / CBS 260.88 / M93) TaxID=1509407 RepID=A0A0L1J9T5_ASPN3|nr:putative apoptosis inducing factor [Aspergillus nomiae NRRL 13137]KNG88504.1 putative apoptosis inducing factor [Aspergillus nomiae NRRL 13137]